MYQVGLWGCPVFCVFLFVGVAGDFIGGGTVVAGVVGEDAGVGFVVGGFDGDGAGGGSVCVGGFGAAVDDLAVVDEVFVGVGGGAGCCPKSEGDGGEDGCGDGFGVHCFSFLGFSCVSTLP